MFTIFYATIFVVFYTSHTASAHTVVTFVETPMTDCVAAVAVVRAAVNTHVGETRSAMYGTCTAQQIVAKGAFGLVLYVELCNQLQATLGASMEITQHSGHRVDVQCLHFLFCDQSKSYANLQFEHPKKKNKVKFFFLFFF